MSFPVISPSSRWYLTAPFAVSSWYVVTSLNPWLGAETTSPKRRYYDREADAGVRYDSACWDPNHFHFVRSYIDGTSTFIQLYRSDRMISTGITEVFDVEPFGGAREIAMHVFSYPEEDRRIVVTRPGIEADPDETHFAIYSVEDDGTFNELVGFSSATAEEISELENGDSADVHSIDYACIDRDNGRMFSKESFATYSTEVGDPPGSAVLSANFERVYMTDITSGGGGTRTLLLENDNFPTLLKKLWHPTYDYLHGRCLIPEQQQTGEIAGLVTGYYDRINAYSIYPDTTLDLIYSALNPTQGVEDVDLAIKVDPVMLWHSGATGKVYFEFNPVPGVTQTDSDVGLFQWDWDGDNSTLYNQVRMANSWRRATYGPTSTLEDFRTALGPGTRPRWEL